MIKHVVWDWNGTLLDDVEACVETLNVMLKRRGMRQVNRNDYIEAFDFPVKNYYWTLGLNPADEDWDRLSLEFHEIYREISRRAGLRKGVVETLERLRELDMPMSVLSACEISILERMMGERNIRPFFGKIYGLTNLHAASKLELGKTLMSEMGVPADNVLLIGDTKHDSAVASELGVRCVLVAGGHQAESRLAGCGREIVAEIGELTSLIGEVGKRKRRKESRK